MTAFWASLAFVVLAEMGDKTQLLAMALATRFKVKVVMGGILMATAANHFLAVVLGNYITDIIPIRTVQIAAAASFVLFGLWTIRGDELEGEDKRFNFSPFWTVFVAFFLAEMGDKTQLATVAMAAKYQSIVPVWIGTTTAMIIADALGIVVGITLGKKIPERAVKWFAAVIFISFGIIGLYEYLPEQLVMPVVGCSLFVVVPAGYLLARGNRKSLPVSDKGEVAAVRVTEPADGE